MEKKAANLTRAPPNRSSQSQSSEEPSSKKFKLWENLSDSEDEDIVIRPPVAVSESRVNDALNHYWDSPRIPQSSDPFAFWRENAGEYPEVFSVAKSTFSCPSGSVDSERLFSVAGDVINVRRTSLTPINAEDQIFLSQNLPYFKFDY